MKVRNLLALAAVTAATVALTVSEAQARPPRWGDVGRRAGQNIDLGSITYAGRGEQGYQVPISSWVAQCNLTHLKLTAWNKDILVTKIYVTYRNGDSDTLDLHDDLPGRGPARAGMLLRRGSPTQWLDLDDVDARFPAGRCINSLTVYAINMPDRRDPSNAVLKLDGYATQRGGPGGPGRPPGGGGWTPGGGGGPGGGPGHGGPGGPGGGWGGGPGHGGPGRPPGRVDYLSYPSIGQTDLFSKGGSTERAQVGGVPTGYIALVAVDDDVEITGGIIYFEDGRSQRVPRARLSEKQGIEVQLIDRARIQTVEISGISTNLIGSKGRIDIRKLDR